MISYRETVEDESYEVALAKSANKHNRIFIKASPLGNDIVKMLLDKDLKDLGKKEIESKLVSRGFSRGEVSRIWAIGPEPLGQNEGSKNDSHRTCLLIDSTYGIQIPKDARENIVAAFHQVTRQGVLLEAPMYGVRFDLIDAKFHSDTVHRRSGSVTMAAARAMKGAFLLAKPQLVEPMYRANITGSVDSLNPAYAVLGERSATIVDASSNGKTDIIKASLPVRCSFGLADSLRLATKGHAHCSCISDGMRIVPHKDLEMIIMKTREQKGLKSKQPPLVEEFVDRL